MSNATLDAMDTTLVKLVFTTGEIGWGETCPLGSTYATAHARGARAALVEMGQGLIGTSAAPSPLHDRMDRLLSGHN
jgi:4-hydroxyproline betaine 2-epimerase